MGIDTSIYGLLRPQEQTPFDPGGAMVKALQLKQLMRQGQVDEMDMATRKAALAESERGRAAQASIRDILSQPGMVDPKTGTPTIAALAKIQGIDPATGQRIAGEIVANRDKLTQADQREAETKLKQQEALFKAHDRINNTLRAVAQSPNPQAAWTPLYQQARERDPHLLEYLQQHGLGEQWDPQAANAVVMSSVGVLDQIKQEGEAEVRKETNRHNLSTEANARTNTGIAAGHLAIAKQKAGTDQAQTEIANGDPKEILASLPANDQALVKQLAARQIMVGRQGGFQLNNPRNQTLYALATRLNPSLSVIDNGTAKKFMDDMGSSSPNSAGGRVDAANRMLGHANDLMDVLDKLNPGSGFTGRIGNLAAYPMEAFAGKNLKAASFIKGKLLGEVNKLVTGGVPHADEMKKDIENLPDTATKEQWASVLKAITDVGLEQVQATEEKRNNILGAMAPETSLLSPKAQAAAQRVYKYAGAPPHPFAQPSRQGYTNTAIEGAGGTPQKRLSPQEAAALPSGTKFIGLDGVERTKH